MISAVIVTYNSSQVIGQCITALLESFTHMAGEIIVVDNHSQDNTFKIIRNILPDGVLIRMRKNYGFAAGVNVGVSISRGQYILLCNPDLIMNPNCVKGMLRFLQINKNVGVVGPALINESGERQYSCRQYPTFVAVISRKFSALSKVFFNKQVNDYLMERTVFSGPKEVDWLIGACIMIRSECFKEIDGFDEHFFLYCEDIDFCYRMHKRGKKIYYLPYLTAIHHYNRESSRGFNRKLICHIKSMIYLFRKHGFRIS